MRIRRNVVVVLVLALAAALAPSGAPAGAAACPNCVYRIAGSYSTNGTGYDGLNGPPLAGLLQNPTDVAVGDDGTVWITQAGSNTLRYADGGSLGAAGVSTEITAVAPIPNSGGKVVVGTVDGKVYTLYRDLVAPTLYYTEEWANVALGSPIRGISMSDFQTAFLAMTDQGTIVRAVKTLGSTPNVVATGLSGPRDVHVANGSVYFSDTGANTVRRLSLSPADGPTARDVPITVTTQVPHPVGLTTLPDGRLVVTDALGPTEFAGNQSGKVWLVTGSSARVIAGTGTGGAGPTVDGKPATSTVINYPQGIASDPAGRLYVTNRFAVSVISAAWAPFGSFDALITWAYAKFLLRTPTAGELSAERAKLVAGTDTPGSLIDRLRLSPTWDGKLGPVIRLYQAYFLRLPDKGGLDFWVGKLRSGTTLNQVSASFAASSEFKTRYGSLTNGAFVDLVYQNVLGRPPDSGGRAYWLGRLNGGLGRGSMMTAFSESTENKREQARLVAVVELHRGMFGRMPTATERTADVAALATLTVKQYVEVLFTRVGFVV